MRAQYHTTLMCLASGNWQQSHYIQYRGVNKSQNFFTHSKIKILEVEYQEMTSQTKQKNVLVLH